jgi:4-amino-4-deoxy-L-arabinose transferase-like glycosyltransferase
MPARQRLPKTLWLILAVALALRLVGAWRANLIHDERAHLAVAETIDLRPESFHLVSRSLDHPFLSIYVVKLSGVLFGTSDFGLRVLHVLAGAATVVPVFLLGRRVFSEQAGLWAAGLLAVDQFHVSWSRVFMPEVLVLLLGSLAILQFLRVLERGSTTGYALLGVLLGLAYLAKEPGLLLVPVLWIYLLVTPEHRRVLLGWRWYLAHGVFLLVIGPDVVWNLTQLTESYLYRDAALLAQGIQVSLKPLSLYLGELFRVVIDADVLDVEYEQGMLYACLWPAGLLYLVGIVAATGRRREPGVRLLVVAFWTIFVVFLVLPGGERFDPFWWASLTLIPGVLAGGWLLARVTQKRRAMTAAAVAMLCGLGAANLSWLWNHGSYRPRATVEEFAADFIRRGNDLLAKEEPTADDLHQARQRFIYVLNLAGPNAEAYAGLARVAILRGNDERARTMAQKALALEPGHGRARELMEGLRGGD